MKKPSFKDIAECRMSDTDCPSFESFVEENFKQHGFVLTEEEEKLVQEAIERTLLEQTAQGINEEDFDEEHDNQLAAANDNSSIQEDVFIE